MTFIATYFTLSKEEVSSYTNYPSVQLSTPHWWWCWQGLNIMRLCGPCWETISNSLNKVIYVTYHKSIKLGNPRYNSHKLGEPVKLFRNMPKTVWFIFPRRQLGESKAIVAVHWWFPWVPCLPCRPLPLKIQKHKDKDTTCLPCHPFMLLTVQQKQTHHRNTMMSKK